MTKHDYKAARAEFERIISTHPDYAGVTIHDDHPVAVISRAIRITDKLMQEPTMDMCHCGAATAAVAAYNGAVRPISDIFKAMRDKMLKEVE